MTNWQDELDREQRRRNLTALAIVVIVIATIIGGLTAPREMKVSDLAGTVQALETKVGGR